MTKAQKFQLVLLGFSLFCVGIVLGVVSRLPEKQDPYTPYAVLPGTSKHHIVLQYRFPNGRGLSVNVRTYSDASASYAATPSRYCTEGMDLWEQDGPEVRLRSVTEVTNLLRRRSTEGPPECLKTSKNSEVPDPLPNGAVSCRITHDSGRNWWVVGFDAQGKVVGGLGLTDESIRNLRQDLWNRCAIVERRSP